METSRLAGELTAPVSTGLPPPGAIKAMRGEKVSAPSRIAMVSPAWAEKVQESTSPAGEMVPAWLAPLFRAPWAKRFRVLRTAPAKQIRIDLEPGNRRRND